ncbi:unnamed protein product [Cylindrotheca closterium]|uniref:Arf-GAP domain-containing protein n=1 Tax=Cylindrotheca closterium TaxID=2856 RepID=A0AAD2CLG5_9STRA|nr:unnamed protein product [Cylindrotheca closterium]
MPSLDERVDNLISKVDNQRCADCFDKQPANVTILLGSLEKPIGAFICFRCARVHEKFPNDVGYVLNARNEADWSEEEVQALEQGSNKIVNAIFESKIAYDHPRPDVNSQLDVREKFIVDKYIDRIFFSESKAAKLMKAPAKESSARFALKAPKDSGSTRGFNSSDSSGDFSFDTDDGLGYENSTPDVAAGVNDLSLDAAAAAPRQRRTRRRASIGINDSKGPPSRTMSLQVEGAGAANQNVRRQRPGRRQSLGRTSSMGGAGLAPGASGDAQGGAPRARRPGRRGSVSGGGPPSLAGSSSNLSQSGAGQTRQRRPGRRGSVGGGGPPSLDNHFNSSNNSLDISEAGDGNRSVASRDRRRLGKGSADPLGGSSHQERRRPRRRGSISVEDANAKLNEKKEMVW